MIDFLDIELPMPSLNNVQRQRIVGHGKTKTFVNRQHLTVFAPGMAGKQQALICTDVLRLQFCPPKVLGHWNCIGSDDLRDLVSTCVPHLLNALNKPPAECLDEQLEGGNFRIREMHIAHQFFLHHYDQSDFVIRVFRQINESAMPELSVRGTGFSINGRSRNASWYLYAKSREFEKRGEPFYERARAEFRGWKWAALAWDYVSQRAAAHAGPRLELRLGDKYFDDHEKQRGSFWSAERVEEVYREQLAKLEFPYTVDPVYTAGRLHLIQRRPIRATYKLWAAGDDLKDAGSRASLHRHGQEIKNVLGVDIKKPANEILKDRVGVQVGDILRWRNRVTPEMVARVAGESDIYVP